MQTLARPDQHQPDDDLPNIPTLTPLDSAQARRADRMPWPEAPGLAGIGGQCKRYWDPKNLGAGPRIAEIRLKTPAK